MASKETDQMVWCGVCARYEMHRYVTENDQVKKYACLVCDTPNEKLKPRPPPRAMPRGRVLGSGRR